jgi:hypothetical protein
MLKINVVNLVMFIVTMFEFIMAKPTMAQLLTKALANLTILCGFIDHAMKQFD